VVIDKLISFQKAKNFDYLANTVPPETSFWPDGSDVEIFTMEALERAHREATDIQEREHVTFYFWKNPGGSFKVGQIENVVNWSQYRFTVDYLEDFEVISFLIKELKKEKLFGHIDQIVSILKKNKEIAKLNEKYHFGIGWKQ
jgi:spore coat polysaccharide biosynthesis protein SpsF